MCSRSRAKNYFFTVDIASVINIVAYMEDNGSNHKAKDLEAHGMCHMQKLPCKCVYTLI